MTKEEIIRMAREANLPSCHLTHPKALERFAALVADAKREQITKDAFDAAEKAIEVAFAGAKQRIKAAFDAEREACAKVVENYCGAWDDQGYALAAAIRARGEK
jgi:CHASE3 domain sensor protein